MTLIRTADRNSARNFYPYHMIILSASILNFDVAAMMQRSDRWKLINKRRLLAVLYEGLLRYNLVYTPFRSFTSPCVPATRRRRRATRSAATQTCVCPWARVSVVGCDDPGVVVVLLQTVLLLLHLGENSRRHPGCPRAAGPAAGPRTSAWAGRLERWECSVAR